LIFTAALRIYIGIWRAVTVKLKAEHIEPGGFCQGCMSVSECKREKVTEHEVPEVSAPGFLICRG